MIAGTGLGHTATDLLESIRSTIAAGKPVVMTSQCIHGSVNMNIYSTGRELLSAGVIPGADMLPETAFTKLMWVLGSDEANDGGMDKVREMMLTNMVGEMSPGAARANRGLPLASTISQNADLASTNNTQQGDASGKQ